MAVPWGLVVIVVGLVYGYAKPGKQSKWQIFKTGIVVGLILGLIAVLLGGLGPLGGLVGGGGFLSTLVGTLILTVLFIVGVFVGDLLE